jgi:pyrimidine-nucleoside phosphorylase
VHLGAGRAKKGDPIDHRTGVVLHCKVGDRVERGQPIADVHVAGRPDDASAVAEVRGAFRFSPRRVARRRLFLGRIAGRARSSK